MSTKENQSLNQVIDDIFYDLQIDLHEALQNYEKDLQSIVQDTQKKLKK